MLLLLVIGLFSLSFILGMVRGIKESNGGKRNFPFDYW